MDFEILAAAQNAVTELQTINYCLLNIANLSQKSQSKALECILYNLVEQHNGRISMQIEEKTAMLRVPEIQFHMLLDELIENAKTAVKGKRWGKITIHVQLEKVHLIGRKRLIIEVIDNGIGMEPDVLAKAMFPFFSTKAGNHVGLGLTGCEQMIRALEGKLSLTSRPGKGTKVRISIPLRRNQLACYCASRIARVNTS